MNYKKRILLCGILVVMMGVVFNMFPYTYLDIEKGAKPVINPLKGYAPLAEETEYNLDTSLVNAIIKWSELEVKEGYYDFESFEERIHMEKWKAEGKRFIFRIVCDKPENEATMEIPVWLYEKTKDGTWYDTSYGKGYSPNYANEVFIEAHQKLLSAISERYNDDPYVLCIQLGTLGHWGEWHVNSKDGTMSFPKAEVYNQYITQYAKAFTNTLLQVRRPLSLANKLKLGVYNDVLGDEAGTYEWLDWIQNGYVSSQTKEEIGAMYQNLSTVYVGGEIASYEAMEYYYNEGLASMLQQISDIHMSYIGPNSPIWLEGYDEEVSQVQKELGYCFQISEFGYREFFNKAQIKLTLTNLNHTAMAQNWKVRIYVYDDETVVSTKDLDYSLTALDDTKTITAWLTVPNGDYHIGVGIIDPITDTPSVALANTVMLEENIYKLK